MMDLNQASIWSLTKVSKPFNKLADEKRLRVGVKVTRGSEVNKKPKRRQTATLRLPKVSKDTNSPVYYLRLILCCITVSLVYSNYVTNSQNNNNNKSNFVLADEYYPSSSVNNGSRIAQQPSQLFLPPVGPKAQPISFVGALSQKRSEEEEEGFIMQSSAPLQSSSSITNLTENNTVSPLPQTITITDQSPEESSTSNSASINEEGTTTIDDRVPIDVNRQQFLTHDQLSLLNASTKDENINLTGSSHEEDNTSFAASRSGNSATHKVPTSRAGLSKVSHVSSFLSDLFSYATRTRQPVEEEPKGAGSRTGQPVSVNHYQQQQQVSSSPAYCPGVCRSILTASILCRGEINAPCPSFFQKCCDRDDVSLNGTPVETSAPLSAADTDQNQAALANSVAPTTTEQTTSNSALNPSTASTASSTLPTTTAASSSQSSVDVSTASGSSNGSDGPEFVPSAHLASQSGTIYFLSSANGSSLQEQQYGNKWYSQSRASANGDGKSAQPVHEEQAINRSKQTASQSFDLPVTSNANTKLGNSLPQDNSNVAVNLNTTGATNKPIVLQTASGSIVHQPRRPAYANWTDYQLLMMRTPGQPVVYHSNTDPVRRFVEQNFTTTSRPSTSTIQPVLDLRRDESARGQAEHTNNNNNIRRNLAEPDQQQQDQLKVKVINDQHSVKPTEQPSTSEDPTTNEETANQSAGSSAAFGVGSVLVDLLDSWISGSSSSSSSGTGGSNDDIEAGHASGPQAAFASPSANDQTLDSNSNLQNDRRLGYDLSFRQQQQGENTSKAQQQDVNLLMTSDGSSEQALIAGDQVAADKCTGYCAMPLFSMLCDSTYKSADCGASQKCCVIGRHNSPIGGATSLSDTLGERPPICRGACLPVYHSSLCTRPAELQLDATGCMANYVCCSNQASTSESTNQLDEQPNETSLSMVNGLDQAGSAQNGESQIIRDNSFLAALLPPPPPPPTVALNEQQLIQEKSGQPVMNLDSSYGQQNLISRVRGRAPQQQQQQQQHSSDQSASAQRNPSSGASKSNQTGGGFINQIYQMFKSSGPGKQRARDKPNSSSLQQQQQQLMQVPQNSFPQNIMPQIYEQYQNNPIRSGINQQQQTVVFPVNQLNQILGIGSGFTYTPSAYPIAAAAAGSAENLMDQTRQQSRNRFTQQLPSVMRAPVANQQQLESQQIMSTNLHPNVQKFNAHPQSVNNPYQLHHQQQQQQLLHQHQIQQYQQQQQQLSSHINLAQQLTENNKLMSFGENLEQNGFATLNPHQQPPSQLISFNNQQQLGGFALSNRQQQSPSIKQQAGNGYQHPVSFSSSLPAGERQRHSQQQQQPSQPQQLHLHDNAHNQPFNQQQQVGQQQQAVNKQQNQFLPHQSSRPLSPFNLADVSSTMTTSIVGGRQTGTNLAAPKPYDPNLQIVSQATNQMRVQQPAKAHQQRPGSSVEQINNNSLDSQKPSSIVGTQHQQQVNTRNQQSDLQPSRATAEPADSNRLQRPISSPASASTSAVPVTPVKIVSSSGTRIAGQSQLTAKTSTPAASMAEAPSNLNVMISSMPSGLLEAAQEVLQVHQPTAELLFLQGTPTPDLVENSCPSVCLTPPASCLKPDYIDENLTCSSSGSVCCMKGASVSSVIKPESTGSNLDGNKLDTLDQIDDQVGEQADNIDSNVSAQRNKLQSSCGVPGPRRISSGRAKGRVMGGFEAKPNYFCWQTALMNNKNEYLCGGALIGSKWVLTAAHCVTQHLRSESPLYVRIGQHDLNSTESGKNARTIHVKTSYVHHNHNAVTLENDIALLRLEEAAEGGADDPGAAAICTICLPERSSNLEAGKRCIVSGYGFETENGPAALRVRQAELPILGDQECQRKTSTILEKTFSPPASSFCAGGEPGQDACHGDGGSPFSCLVDGYYELAGIVSWGYKCGSKDLPGLYTKVSTFVGWINQIVSVNN